MDCDRRNDNTATSTLETSVADSSISQWWNDAGLRKLNFLLLSCFLCATANGYVSSLISSLIINPQWFIDLPDLFDVKLLGLAIAAHPLGCIIAFLPRPWLSDKHGRRAGIILGNIGMTAGFLGQIFCKTYSQYLSMRLLVGLASFCNTVSSAALLLELAHPRQRAVAGALFNTCYFIGSGTSAWTSYGALNLPGSWSWRLPVAIQLFWTVAQFALILFCPKLPRWLVANGKEEQARAAMITYYANGRANDSLVHTEMLRIRASAEADKQNRGVGWLALCSTPGNRKRLVLSVTIGVATQWVGNGVMNFYLAPVLSTVGITSSFKQQGINGGLQVYNWILPLGAALLAERLGRRRLFLTSAGTMLAFMSVVTICSAFYSATRSMAASYAVIVFLFLFFGGYVIGLTPIPILYVNEIWPNRLRAKGTSVFWGSQAVATCFNQYVNPIALARITWKYYLVYVGVLVATVVFMFYYVPETKGLSLEEVSDIFDGQQANVTLQFVGSSRESEV